MEQQGPSTAARRMLDSPHDVAVRPRRNCLTTAGFTLHLFTHSSRIYPVNPVHPVVFDPVHLTLFIPDLLPPSGAESAMADSGSVLRRMLGRGQRRRFPAIAAEAWLCQAFEVEQREDWPVAALTAAVDGLVVENEWWLRADPVHLQLQRHGTRVMAAPAITLNEEESVALSTALNAHFGADGITVAAPHTARWYIRQDAATGLTAPLPSTVAGRALPGTPFSGSHASHWHRVLTEAQMVLHEHPLNQAREARGLPVINSLLLWGGGRKPAVPGRHFSQIWSNDPLATALAVQSGADSHEAPGSAALWFGKRPKPDAQHLMTLDRAHHASRYEGPEAWLKAINHLEELWFGPLWGALDGPLQELVIVATGPEGCLRCTLRRADKMKIWRRPLTWTTVMSGSA